MTEIKIVICVILLSCNVGIIGPAMVSHRSYELPIAWLLVNVIIGLYAINQIKKSYKKFVKGE